MSKPSCRVLLLPCLAMVQDNSASPSTSEGESQRPGHGPNPRPQQS